MPSEPKVAMALAALARPAAEFRALLQGAVGLGDEFRNSLSESEGDRARRSALGLGEFAVGRIDAARFAQLFCRAPGAEPASLAALEQALKTLRAFLAHPDHLFVAEVVAGARVGGTVNAALARAGRALNAVMLVEAVRSGRYDKVQHARLLESAEFLDWNRAERRVAPPLVITVDGAALHAGALADFADGQVKIVLVVRGACPPAPLARCVTPGMFVLQTVDGTGLDRLAHFDGPAVAAIVPETAAQFVHDPALGREPWQRITIRAAGEPPKKAIGGMSVYQMAEDLRVLHDLARTPFAVPTPGGAATPALGAPDAVDKIASWLLGQSGLPGTG